MGTSTPQGAKADIPGGRTSATWSQERRLEFIDYRLRWDGRLNRSDLIDVFGISVPQASLDISRYLELAPHNVHYDRSARVYLATPEFSPILKTGDSSRFLGDLLGLVAGTASRESSFIGWTPPTALTPIPRRVIQTETLVRLLRAMRGGRTLVAEYQSMSRPAPVQRKLAPHALAFDGFRWHVRAYCFTRKSFRDFVIARMLAVEVDEPSEIDPKLDVQWEQTVRIVLVPHPALSESRRKVVELDYGMVDGESYVECRQALLFYFLKHLGFNQPQTSGLTKQVAIKNEAEVRALLPAADE